MATATLLLPARSRFAAAVLPDDVAAVFADVCAHRLILSPKARIAETTAKDVLAEVVQQVPRPDHI